MKKLSTILLLIMFGFSAVSFGQGCQIPPNYFQDPNFEHNLSPLVWTGSWDWGYHHVVADPGYWITDTTQVHSPTHCMVITYNSWIWPAVSTVGFEEKSMKMSFWYKSPIGKMAFWMFAYRDAKLTPEEIRPPLKANLIGADTAYITYTAGTSKEEALYFEMGKSTEWKYFEFKFDYPGSIPGSIMTLMFWSEFTPGFIDDVYYGVDFPCVYNGEEEVSPTGVNNSDFEASDLGVDWFFGWNKNPAQFLSTDENHTAGGQQSLKLFGDNSSTYYLPVQGDAGKTMDFDFWYKGNANTLSMSFYKDYHATVADMPLPAGAIVGRDSTIKYNIDTSSTTIDTTGYKRDTTFVYDHNTILGYDTLSYSLQIAGSLPIDTFTIQDFTNDAAAPYPINGQWSGSWYFWDWPSNFSKTEFYNDSMSLWLPGDPNWSGDWGGSSDFQPCEDHKAIEWSFMYKGKLSFELFIGRDLKYNLGTDPEKVVPKGAKINSGAIHWDLNAVNWTKFSYAWKQGTWLADSGLSTPQSVGFNYAGTSTGGDNGYLDHLMVRKTKNTVGPGHVLDSLSFVVDTIFKVLSFTVDSTPITSIHYQIDTLSSYYVKTDTVAAIWNLPAAADWTEYKVSWTNPQMDLGTILGFYLQSNKGQGADTITYYDDFTYGVSTGVSKHPIGNSFQIYPNPVGDVLYLGTAKQVTHASIYNSFGQKLIDIGYPGGNLDVSGLKTGLYILNVSDENGKEYLTKFIKK